MTRRDVTLQVPCIARGIRGARVPDIRSPTPAAPGFTLVEVLVALAIVALGLGALLATTTESVRASSYLREKTLAQWIALNRITEARLEGQPPADEDMSGDLEYAGETWRWELKTIKTPVSGIVRLEARAARAESAQDTWPGFATGFMGNAIAPPGGPPLNWLGDSRSGSPPPPGSAPRPAEPPETPEPPEEPPDEESE
jgi:general secretion pathway protein I